MAKVLPILLIVVCAIVGKVTAVDDWWEYGHFYQVYPRSFQDSDGDGIGDIKGITMRLPFLKSINVTGIWLSPIFKSPMKDFGYDISDFREIQPEYGTMEDFEELLARGRELDIKIILDFVPNHCSDQHEWFQRALNKSDPEHQKYKNYFIWNEGKPGRDGKKLPPSNWLSIFRGSAWEWVDDLQAFYLHQFLEEQPDLNFRNSKVVEELNEVLRFWLRKGVDGFRIDAVPFIFESKEKADGYYDDEPRSGECNDDPLASCYLNHTETKDQDETYDMLYQWRRVMEEPEFDGHTRILMAEGYTSVVNTLRYYGRIENGEIVENGTQIPFNFLLLSNTWMSTGTYGFIQNILDWVNNLPEGAQANWVLGNHDNKRIATRYKPSRTDLFNILLKTLPGVTVTYYGEEIGMTNVFVSWEDTVDPQAIRTSRESYEWFSRDPERTPYQWNSSTNAGFSSANKTWLPIAPNYTECNFALQSRQERSFLKNFRDLMFLRNNSPAMKYGGLQIIPVDTEVMVYKRSIAKDPNADIIVVILNLEGNTKTIDLNAHLDALPKEMTVAVASIHSEELVKGQTVYTSAVKVTPDVGIVLIDKKTTSPKPSFKPDSDSDHETEAEPVSAPSFVNRTKKFFRNLVKTVKKIFSKVWL